MTVATSLPQPALQSHSGAEFFVRVVRQQAGLDATQLKVLVAGCGTGHEAAFLQSRLNAEVDAIDIEIQPDEHFLNIAGLRFQTASVLDLPFEPERFDAVFYHHVIEHVSDPAGSLAEIHRVMRRGGWLFVGTPNRHRLISSIGAHQQANWAPTLINKLRDNMHDWSARLRGRFRNECGAHAGFSKRELDGMLAMHFCTRYWLTKDYLRCKYSQHPLRSLVWLATSPPLRWCLAPSIYVLCQK